MTESEWQEFIRTLRSACDHDAITLHDFEEAMILYRMLRRAGY